MYLHFSLDLSFTLRVQLHTQPLCHIMCLLTPVSFCSFLLQNILNKWSMPTVFQPLQTDSFPPIRWTPSNTFLQCYPQSLHCKIQRSLVHYFSLWPFHSTHVADCAFHENFFSPHFSHVTHHNSFSTFIASSSQFALPVTFFSSVSDNRYSPLSALRSILSSVPMSHKRQVTSLRWPF